MLAGEAAGGTAPPAPRTATDAAPTSPPPKKAPNPKAPAKKKGATGTTATGGKTTASAADKAPAGATGTEDTAPAKTL